MFKNRSKVFIPIVSMVLMLCLLAQVLPLSFLGMATAQEVAIQEPVTRSGRVYADVTTFAGNSGAILGDKVTANGAKHDIKLNGEIVGNFVFNKNNQYIEITITDNVAVDVTWSCSSKYANCTLYGTGIYKIPQLLQNNGKTQTFDAIWVADVRQNNSNNDDFPKALSTEELLAKYSYGIPTTPFTDAVRYETPRIIPVDISEITKEDEYRLGCYPGYFTPEQVTVSDTIDITGQRSMANPLPVKIIVIIDTEAYDHYRGGLPKSDAMWAYCCNWANNIIEGGDDMLEIWYGIDFQTQSPYFELWDSPNYMNYHQLWDELQKTNPSSVGCDVIILMTGQYDSARIGCGGGHSIVMDITCNGWPNFMPLANLFQHEASHLFGCPDHDPGYTTICIMSYTWDGSVRNYCKSGKNCDGIMMNNRCWFD